MKRLTFLACLLAACGSDDGAAFDDGPLPDAGDDTGASMGGADVGLPPDSGVDGGAEAMPQAPDAGSGGVIGAAGAGGSGGVGGSAMGGAGGAGGMGGSGGVAMGGMGGTAPVEMHPPTCTAGVSTNTCGTLLDVSGQQIYRTKVIAGIKYLCFTSEQPTPFSQCRRNTGAISNPAVILNPWRLRVQGCGECMPDPQCKVGNCPNACATCMQDYPNNTGHCLAACGS